VLRERVRYHLYRVDAAAKERRRREALHRIGVHVRRVDEGVSELVASQAITYHAEMRFVPYQPFIAALWVSRIGRSSFTVSAELRVEAGGGPAAVWECVNVLWDHRAQTAWTISDAVRADLERYLGEPVGFRR
jgi:acyl-CoA thioester hydrolase